MNLRYEVKSTPTLDGSIFQEIELKGPGIDDIHQVVRQQVIHTQDAQVREALISLGWTPPDQSKGMHGLDRMPNNERDLRRMLMEMHREHQERIRPLIAALASIESLKPAPPFFVSVEEIDKLKNAGMFGNKS